MGGFPCECCEQATCVCLTYNDLPEITVPGFRVQIPLGSLPWTESGDCCWKQTLIPIVFPEWSCSAYTLQSYDWSHTCQSKSYTWKNFLPPVFQGNAPIPCPLPSWFCCPPDLEPVLVGTTNSTFSFRGSVVFFLVYRVLKIEVFITRKILTCENQQVCKYIVASKYYYEYRTDSKVYAEQKVTRLATVNLNCFSKHPEYDYDSADLAEADEDGWYGFTGKPQTCEDVDQAFINNMDGGGVFSFDRIRLFDTMPTGDVLFNNSNVLYSLPCEVSMTSLCLTQLNQDTQVCIYTPTIDDVEDDSSAIVGTPPCWCNMTENALVTVPTELYNRCDYFEPIGNLRDQFKVYYCDDSGIGVGLEPGNTTCVILQGGCDDTKPPCDTYNKQCAPLDWVDYPSTNCLVTLAPDSVGIDLAFDCGCNGSPFSFSAIPEPGNCGPCFETFVMDCPECEEVNPYKCYQAYLTDFNGSPKIRTIDSKQLTWNCSGVTQYSQCINAPSWTLTFPT